MESRTGLAKECHGKKGNDKIPGVPSWDGDPVTLDDYETESLWYRQGLKANERNLAASRLWQNLRGSARNAVRHCLPGDFEGDEGVEKLLKYLRGSPLGRQPLPDAYKKIDSYHEIKRRMGEPPGEYILREKTAFENMEQALMRLRKARRTQEGQARGSAWGTRRGGRNSLGRRSDGG